VLVKNYFILLISLDAFVKLKMSFEKKKRKGTEKIQISFHKDLELLQKKMG